MADPLVLSAGLILVRDGDGLETLMTQRSMDLAFGGGAQVFPGGRVDPGDHDPAWEGLAIGWGRIREDLRGAAIAAVRETFEETGVLIADGAVADCGHRRGGLLRRETTFFEIIHSAGVALALDRLHYFAHWIAPDTLHRRFDARFFLCDAPTVSAPTADGCETEKVFWVTPNAALKEAQEGKRRLMFPTRRKLELLALSATADAARTACASRPVAPIKPQLVARGDRRFAVIPEGLGYPITEEELFNEVSS
jgi:8-oxo-dGTP pyrophosphatase MutT (NUDIX family)